jgi:hypothetical protein
MFKAFVPTHTAEKIEVEANRDRAKAKMLQFVDAAVLPSCFGGDFSAEWRMLL